jgi:F-type H+-transporting ATPase subunit a
MHEGIHIALKADAVAHVFGIPITNTMLMSWIVMLVLIVLGYSVGKHLVKIPGKLQTFFEALFSFLLDYLEEVLESRELARRFFPLIATLFMFILLGNWFGLLPGIGSIYVEPADVHAQESHHITDPTLEQYHEATSETVAHEEVHEEHHTVSLFHPISVDLNVTLALAIVSFVVVEAAGIAYVGLFSYLGKFFNFRSPIGFLVGIIELISEFVRLVSFSFRLFGNMFAGKTLILVAMFFVPYILPVPLMAYEVFVGFIQASIFALLTLFFIKLAITPAH